MPFKAPWTRPPSCHILQHPHLHSQAILCIQHIHSLQQLDWVTFQALVVLVGELREVMHPDHAGGCKPHRTDVKSLTLMVTVPERERVVYSCGVHVVVVCLQGGEQGRKAHQG